MWQHGERLVTSTDDWWVTSEEKWKGRPSSLRPSTAIYSSFCIHYTLSITPTRVSSIYERYIEYYGNVPTLGMA